jgi:hypothetical protein
LATIRPEYQNVNQTSGFGFPDVSVFRDRTPTPRLAAILESMRVSQPFWIRVTGAVLMLVGLLWGAFVSWLSLMMGGLEMLHWAYIGKALLWLGWMFIGPLFLVVGPILYTIPRRRTLASILLLVGCVVLSSEVGYQLVSMFHDLADPLIMRPPYGLYAGASILTALADICALHLFRNGARKGGTGQQRSRRIGLWPYHRQYGALPDFRHGHSPCGNPK